MKQSKNEDKISVSKNIEKMRPFPNIGGVLRRVFDLQISSTYHSLEKTISKVEVTNEDVLLDVGCGAMPWRDMFPKDCKYIGIDTFDAEKNFDYNSNGVIYYDGITFPVEDASISFVFHSEVMEHIYDTRHFLSECYRVLKKNGTMVFTVPFQARYHYIPFDYWRFTPSSIDELLKANGFFDIDIRMRGTDISVAGYKVLAVGYRLFFSKIWWKVILSILFAPAWVLGLLIGQLSIYTGIGSYDDCLGYTVCCKKE